MATKYLSKTDFKHWQFCPTSAHHGWQNQPTNQDGNSFLSYLAQEGKTIGALGRRLLTNGQHITDPNLGRAVALTRAALEAEQATLYEVCLTYGDFVLRPDILLRKGGKIFVIEVKSKLGKLDWHRSGKMLVNMYACRFSGVPETAPIGV